MPKRLLAAALWLAVLIILRTTTPALAVTGACVNCHTMHNSQDNSPMATFPAKGVAGTGPNSFLTRGTCIGCHAQGSGSNIVTIGGSEIPQVFHTNATDLAGGNFAYIDGTKAGAGSASGHNVTELFGVNSDANLNFAPGASHIVVSDSNLTCSGSYGCHGTRNSSNIGTNSLKGAHHGNVNGQLNTADTVANSYMFLYRVKGYENTVNKWRNVDANSHHEYFGATTPMPTFDCFNCHTYAGAAPVNQTISGYCATCHGAFHDLGGIGGDVTSPFVRHPTDVVIKNSDEYAAYTTYNVLAPPGRPAVPAAASNTVVPGTDVVTCLSCHASHASKYPDMLKWDYDGECLSHAGDGTKPNCGCFVCHTTKDN